MIRAIETFRFRAGERRFNQTRHCTTDRKGDTYTTYNCSRILGNIFKDSDHIGRPSTRDDAAIATREAAVNT
jgi:hypothetical protein